MAESSTHCPGQQSVNAHSNCPFFLSCILKWNIPIQILSNRFYIRRNLRYDNTRIWRYFLKECCKIYSLSFFFFKNRLCILELFRFIAKLSGNYRDFPHTSCRLPHYQHPLPAWFICFNWCIYIYSISVTVRSAGST